MSVERINVEQAKNMMTKKNVVVIDIRDEQSFMAGHIEGATRIDNLNIQQFIEETASDSKVLVCCYHGISSLSAAAYLESQGFQNLYSLDGGMTQWLLQNP